MIALRPAHAKGATREVIVGRQESSAVASVMLVAVDVDSVDRGAKAVAIEKGAAGIAKVVVAIVSVVAETEKDVTADSRATIVRAVVLRAAAVRAAAVRAAVLRAGIAQIAPSEVIAASDVALATPAGHREPEVDSAIVMMAGFRARHASATSGASALIASATHVGRAATPNDVVPAHRRLDRGDRRCDVQWEERGAHQAR